MGGKDRDDGCSGTTALGTSPPPLPPHAGNVPALVLDDGTLLNEGAAVLQCLADMARAHAASRPLLPTHAQTPAQKPAAKAVPEPKSTARSQVQNALNWTASELCVPRPQAAATTSPPHQSMRSCIC